MIMRLIATFIVVMCAVCVGGSARAGEWLQWHSSNVQLLRGHDYKVGEEQRTIVTLEHANGWKYGDNFGFIDLSYPDGEDSTYYLEVSPRLSLGKMTGLDFSYGLIKDVLISTTFEKGRGQGPQYLYGGAVDLNLPGFKFFSANAYVHDSTELDGQTWQVTLAWNRPFEIGGLKFLAEGFADFQGREDTSHSNQLISPRLLLDVGDLAGIGSDRVMAGVEYQYWHNKFGIDGVTESVPQVQLKWIF